MIAEERLESRDKTVEIRVICSAETDLKHCTMDKQLHSFKTKTKTAEQ